MLLDTVQVRREQPDAPAHMDPKVKRPSGSNCDACAHNLVAQELLHWQITESLWNPLAPDANMSDDDTL